jgi:hypothetical protein
MRKIPIFPPGALGLNARPERTIIHLISAAMAGAPQRKASGLKN